jgi:hypothetical protein
VRTFVPYTIGGQSFILAAYTCTPLVKIPASALQPGEKVKGVTITDLKAPHFMPIAAPASGARGLKTSEPTTPTTALPPPPQAGRQARA